MTGRTNPALALQVLAPDRELELRGHVLQVLDPVVENVPAAHAVAMPPTQKEPAGHVETARQVEAPAAE